MSNVQSVELQVTVMLMKPARRKKLSGAQLEF